MGSQTSTLEILLTRFDGAILIPLADAAAALSWPLQTARNRVCTNTCPFPTHKVEGRRVVHVRDLAHFVDQQTGAESPAGPRLGTSSKAERLAARAAGLTVKQLRAQEGGAA